MEIPLVCLAVVAIVFLGIVGASVDYLLAWIALKIEQSFSNRDIILLPPRNKYW